MAKKKRCEKIRYATLGEAEAAKASLLRKDPNVLYVRRYWCGKCRAWHITTKPRPGGRPGHRKH